MDPESDQPVEGVEARPFRNNYQGDMGGPIRVPRDDVFSCIFLINEELFGTPESSKSQG